VTVPPGALTFANSEAAVVAFLRSKGFGSVSVEGPANTFPHIMVTRVTGGDNRFTDHATVDVEAFHSSRSAAATAGRAAHYWITQFLDGLLGAAVSYTADDGTAVTVYIDDVRTIRGPAWLDYGDPKVHRYLASYVVDSRVDSAPL
jgi:hypothetical protein